MTDKLTWLMVLGMLSISGLASAEAVYKYRDQDDGVVIYHDRPPSSDIDDGHSLLNSMGLVIKEVPSRAERERLAQLQEAKMRQELHDRTLLSTFTTERDLVRARDDRVSMIDSIRSRLEDRISILSKRMHVIESRISDYQAQGRDVPDKWFDEQASLTRNIENASILLESKTVERHRMVTKFDADLSRYRELRAKRASASELF